MPVFDLSGILQIQKQYLADLSGIVQADPNQDVSKYVGDVSGWLSTLYNSFGSATHSANSILDHQKEMSTIVDDETKRLIAKKKLIDGEVDGKRRMLELNESYRKRYSAYTQITIVIVITLTLYAILSWFNRTFPLLPPSVVTLLNILIFAVGLIYIIVMYNTISYRDKMNYDELDLPPPPLKATPGDVASATEAGDLSSLMNSLKTCIGQDCCETGTFWNQDKKQCSTVQYCTPDKYWDTSTKACTIIPTCPTGKHFDTVTKTCIATAATSFTTMLTAYSTGDLKQNSNNSPNPYSPDEYNSYGKIGR